MRRNKDGSRHLADLRKLLECHGRATVYCQGGTWIICRWSDVFNAWMEEPCHPSTDERTAIEKALRLEEEVDHG